MSEEIFHVYGIKLEYDEEWPSKWDKLTVPETLRDYKLLLIQQDHEYLVHGFLTKHEVWHHSLTTDRVDTDSLNELRDILDKLDMKYKVPNIKDEVAKMKVNTRDGGKFTVVSEYVPFMWGYPIRSYELLDLNKHIK